MPNEKNNGIIIGRYKHYKNHRYYEVFCVAKENEKEYVLYRQCYGDKSFWIRPYEMFFETVSTGEGKNVSRFAKVDGKKQNIEKRILELIELIRNQEILIRHSETERPYVITHIDNTREYVRVHEVEESTVGGYLTEYELMRRLGYCSCRINDEIEHFKCTEEIPERLKFKIGNNDLEVLKGLINPCSLDLKIAEVGYLKTTFKEVDPQSIEHFSRAHQLWKKVRVHKSKNHLPNYIKIRPGMSVLTHTKERIKIPDDCAGKVEIKSTFARLSISVTAGDFCNPGYDGYFPLEIKNNGHHTILIHEGEVMAQLMLIPLKGPILEGYNDKATFINENGYDDGTPFSFWRERSIKAFRKETGTEPIVDLYKSVLRNIAPDNTKDINGFRERFSDQFLVFCKKRIDKTKYRNEETGQPDTERLLKAFITREKRFKALASIKWGSAFFALICAIVPVGIQLFIDKGDHFFSNFISFLFSYKGMVCSVLFLISVVLTIFLFVNSSKTYCTFEHIDIQKLLKGKNKKDK